MQNVSFASTQPLSKTMSEKIRMIRDWCQNRTRPANKMESVVKNKDLTGRNIQA